MGNLISRLGARAKDQGDRPTCVALAASSVHEYWREIVLYKKKKIDLDLSAEFLYYGCKQTDGLGSDAGTTVGAAADWLKAKGQCLDEFHPYSTAVGPSPKPSVAAFSDAHTRKFAKLTREPAKWDVLEDGLVGDRPVLGVVRIFENAYSVGKKGIISIPTATNKNLGLHAVVFLDVEKSSSGTHAVFLNSWGLGWGDAGLGRFGTEYFEKHCKQLWILTKGDT